MPSLISPSAPQLTHTQSLLLVISLSLKESNFRLIIYTFRKFAKEKFKFFYFIYKSQILLPQFRNSWQRSELYQKQRQIQTFNLYINRKFLINIVVKRLF
jgi:hypothetical protein